MIAANIQTGKPKVEGRYVAFIRCAAIQASDWVEPIIMAWVNGRWQTTHLQNKVIGWLGPLPVMKVTDIIPQEFDL